MIEDGESLKLYDKDIPKEGFHYICLSMILIDSVPKKDENYYPQVFQKNVITLLKKKRLEDVLKIMS